MYIGRNKTQTKRLLSIKSVLVTLATITLAALFSCGPTPTSSAAPVVTDIPISSATTNLQSGPVCPPSVFLPDNAEIFLRRDSRIAIIKISDPTVGQSAD